MKFKFVLILIIGMVIGAFGVYLVVPKSQSEPEATASSAKQLYSCGMHPEVISDKPGDCPICGMKLTPIKGSAEGGKASAVKKEKGKILYWRAPMDPTEIYDKPGKSKMGMDLVPVYEGEEAGGAGSIKIDGAVQQNMNLRLAAVERRDISRVIRAYGKVTYAQNKEYSVNTKFNGWIEKLYVNTEGQRVRKGDPLLEIYSPELVSTQEEYLLAQKNYAEASRSELASVRQSAETMLAAAQKRLTFWDIPGDQISRLQNAKKVRRTILLRSPADGVVTHKAVVEGDKVIQGKDLFQIADLSTVWVEATVYESELPLLRKGQRAELELDYLQDADLAGKVDFIYPYLDQKARAANVRLVFNNPRGSLKPDMFATVRIYSKAASNALAIPTEAVIHSGARKIVFVAQDAGKFEPREVKLGAESNDGYVQVVSGLFDDERVVASGQFLLDSESQTREAIAKMRAAQMQKSSEPAAESKETHSQEMDMSDQNEHSQGDSNVDKAMKQADNDGHQHKDHEHGLYACSMHPDFITSDPDARCPECGMKLTPIAELGDKVKVDGTVFYTCPMHPDFVTTDPDGRCPECGMKLEKKVK